MTYLFSAGLATLGAAALIPLLSMRSSGPSYRRVSFSLMTLGSGLFLLFALGVLATDRPVEILLYEMLPGLALSFHIDRLAAFFIALIAIVSISAGIYSVKYTEHIEHPMRRSLVAAAAGVFVAAMVLVVASSNMFSLLVFWEVMSLSSFFLVMVEYESNDVQKSGLFYFVMTQMSTVFLLFAFIVMYINTGSFAIQPAAGLPAMTGTTVFLLMFTGFGIKAGMVPFHKWLPYAHSASPSNISALMSGVMIKVAIYGMLRFILTVLAPEMWWGMVILVFGTVSALLGVIYALKEHDIKKLLAYHSIENIGIILLGIGLYIIFQSYRLPEVALLALAGGLFHTLNHALFKSLLFLTAGAVVQATGTRDIEHMGGLIKRMPFTGVLFLIGSVSISALPPFNGFVSELMIFQAFFQSFLIGSPFVQIVLFIGMALFALTSALAAACFVKAFGIVFLASPRSAAAGAAVEAPRSMLAGPAILAALCALLGIFSYQILSLAGYQLPVPDLAVIGLLLLFFLGLTLLVMRFFDGKPARTAETWGCGIPSQNGRMEYTASGFSDPILTIFYPIYRTRKSVERRFSDLHRAVFRNGSVEIHTFKLFEERIYMPVAHFVQRISNAAARWQDVDLDSHILYAFITIVILLVLAWWAL